MEAKKSSALFNFVTFVILLFGLIFNILTSAAIGIPLLSSSINNPPWIYLILIAGIISIPFSLVFILDTIKAVRNKSTVITKAKTSARVTFWLTLAVCLAGIIFAGFFIWGMFNEKPPNFIPFDDPEATYTVTKKSDKYMLLYKSTGTKNTSFECTFIDGTEECKNVLHNEVEVMIGNSEVELEPLVNKNVIVDGKFEYSDEQCIAGKCQHIGGWAVLNIDHITLAQ